MSAITRIARFALPAALLIAIAVFALVRPTTPASSVAAHLRDPNFSQWLLRNITGIAKERGLRYAIDVVAESVSRDGVNNNACHTLLHLIGHAAYQLRGDDFGSIFDANRGALCLGGYLHGVEAEIEAEGGDSTAALWRFCAEAKRRGVGDSACFHGVGHSAFELTKRVAPALSRCQALSGGPEPDLANCYRGVFSELGNELLGVDTNTNLPVSPLATSEISPERPYALCASLAHAYQDACYSQLAKLFYQGVDIPGSFAQCAAASPLDHPKDVCVSIIAGIASRNEFESGNVRGLASALMSLPEARMAAALSGVEEGFRSYKTDHPGGISSAALCDELREEWRQSCDRTLSVVRAH